MKRLVLITSLVMGLFGRATLADVAMEETHPAVLGAELTFGAASSILGCINIGHGYHGKFDLGASLVGLGVGVTSLALSAQQDAEIPIFDVVAGTVSVVGAFFRLPRRSATESADEKLGSMGRGLEPRAGVELGCRGVAFRVRF